MGRPACPLDQQVLEGQLRAVERHVNGLDALARQAAQRAARVDAAPHLVGEHVHVEPAEAIEDRRTIDTRDVHQAVLVAAASHTAETPCHVVMGQRIANRPFLSANGCHEQSRATTDGEH